MCLLITVRSWDSDVLLYIGDSVVTVHAYWPEASCCTSMSANSEGFVWPH